MKVPKLRGINLEPEQDKEETSAVRSLMPHVDEQSGAGKTEMETLESTRKQLILKMNGKRKRGS